MPQSGVRARIRAGGGLQDEYPSSNKICCAPGMAVHKCCTGALAIRLGLHRPKVHLCMKQTSRTSL